METLSFSSQVMAHSATPTAAHARLYHFGAILRLVHHLSLALESQEAVFSQFPFLASYVNDLAAGGLEGLTTGEALATWREGVTAWEAAASGFLPLVAVARAVDLDYDALITYFTLGLSEEDARFGMLFEAFNSVPGQHHITYGLLAAWDPVGEHRAALHVRRLRSAGLVQITNPDAPRVDWTVVVQPLLWDVLTGREPSLPPWLRHRPASELLPLDQLVLPAELQVQVARLPALLAEAEIDTLVVRGPQHNGRKTLLGALAAAAGHDVLEIEDGRGDEERWRTAGALAVALHALPVVTYDLAPGETATLPHLAPYRGPRGVALGQTGGLERAGRVLALNVEMPGSEERRQCWQRALATAGGATAAAVENLDAICRQFRLTRGAIVAAADLAAVHARLAGRESIGTGDVRQATRTLNRQALDTLAQPLPPLGDWSLFASHGDTFTELRTLESRCRHRESLLDAVGPSLRTQLNPGVRALFTGPSGSGKTLAARILASVLGMDLYRLDLSSVVNKYIGETEKNLNALFSRAEELDVVLLIDEGDALLTQRTNVQNANDRYANLETNFLLQRLESFTGIVIITTNAGDRIDSAFQRRMDVTVEFRAPEPAERWAIWQLHLPPQHYVDDALLAELTARCNLTGGQIRNIMLHASVLALDDGGVVGSPHLREAVQREYRKVGAVCPLRPEPGNGRHLPRHLPEH